MYKIAVCDTDQYNDGTRVQERYHLLKRINRQLTKQNILKQKTAGTRLIPWFCKMKIAILNILVKKKKHGKRQAYLKLSKYSSLVPDIVKHSMAERKCQRWTEILNIFWFCLSMTLVTIPWLLTCLDNPSLPYIYPWILQKNFRFSVFSGIWREYWAKTG